MNNYIKPTKNTRLFSFNVVNGITLLLFGAYLLGENTSASSSQETDNLEKRESSKSSYIIPLKFNNEPFYQDNVESLLKKAKSYYKVPGLYTIVARSSSIIAANCQGEKILGSGIPVELNDEIRIGSVSKIFTNVLIARLVDKNILSWNSKIGDILPEVAISGSTLSSASIIQLMCHRAGLPRNPLHSLAEPKSSHYYRLTSMKEYLGSPVIGDPGEKFEYSNGGPIFLSLIAEKVSGQSFEDLMKNEVFIPLGINGAGYGFPISSESDTSNPWPHKINPHTGRFQPMSYQDIQKAKWMNYQPQGGMYCKPIDLLKLSYILTNDTGFLTKKTINRFLHDEYGDRMSAGGLTIWNGGPWYRHEGCTGFGDGTVFMFNPINKMAFVLHTNANGEIGGLDMSQLCNLLEEMLT